MDFTSSHDVPSEKEEAMNPFGHAKDIQVSSTSIYSTNTGITRVDDDASFNPGTKLHIHARGHNLIRLPLPSSELEIAITDPSGTPVYTSTREKRCSGNAILSHAKLGDLISTTYFFGPNRDPVIRMLQPVDVSLDMVKVQTRWMSRATAFTLPNGKSFEWFYNSARGDPESREGKGEKINVLVLRQIDADSGKLLRKKKKERGESRAIAKLIRSNETRTEGTSRMTAGNGGELVLDVDAASYMDESIIVATCLMMLKKEIDRRRGAQAAVMAGAAGGGS